jgi:deoxyribodipyrimidine photo-lyase
MTSASPSWSRRCATCSVADEAALVWLRRDLRVHDQPALRAALDGSDTVVPVFCLDDRLLGGRHASGSRVRFMLQCVSDLRRALIDRGGGLVVVHGRPETEIPRLARETGARHVHFSFDVGRFARLRDGRVQAALRAVGAELVAHPGVFAMENPNAIRTGAGTPYTVFTPFHRAWTARSRRALVPTPRSLPALPGGLATGRIPALDALGLAAEVASPLAGGETAARVAAAAWLTGPVAGYGDGRDDLGADDGVSKLSAYLRFGCLSARELEERLSGAAGQQAFARQLAWRDFYGYVLHHFPKNGRREHQARYRDGRLRWLDDEAGFAAWCDGRTGVPLVDAGMRQLHQEGWMHNRVRMVVGSFLTKDLGIDWRRGEAHFMHWLLDGDPASNNGNWQWIASVGVDPAPVYRRILSPARQQQRFDPDGRYVRRYVPELRNVPDRHLAEPWAMPAELQDECGVRIGRDYPEPIVDHAQARREALARYGEAAG